MYAQQPAELHYKNYQVNRSLQTDSAVTNMLQPYTDSLQKQMNTIIGFSNTTWYKKQPESALGNFMTDCLKLYAEKAFQTHVDISVTNIGSIRSYIPKGDIKLQTIYDIIPYDNLVVLQKMNGNTLHQLLDLMAYKGGWPCSGITMKIKNKIAADILINGKDLYPDSIYVLATTDYLANGGDGCSMLKNIAQQNKNYLYRNALIDYVK